MKTVVFTVLFLLVLVVAGTAFKATPVKVLTGDQLVQTDGGGCGSCRKNTKCGSATCVDKKNCSGNSTKHFCVSTEDEDKECSSDGSVISCGKIQECQTDTCATCSPTTTDCNKTISNNGDSC